MRRLESSAVRHDAMLVAGGLLVVMLLYAGLLLPTGAVDLYTEEDGIIEWAGAVGLLAAAALFGYAAWISPGAGWGAIKRVGLVLLAALFLFGSGEEISWGQRIFGLTTPEALREANVQDEINVHNLGVFKATITPGRLFQVFWFSLGVIVPMISAISPKVRQLMGRWLPIFSVAVAVLLVAQQVLGELIERWLGASSGTFAGTDTVIHSRVEVTESIVAIILAVGAAQIAASARRARHSPVHEVARQD